VFSSCAILSLLLLMIRSPLSSTLLPYTTLFRSFPLHLLSLSGTSGGSVGNSAYYSFLKSTSTLPSSGINPEKEMDDFFSSDFLRSEEHTSELQSRENLVCRLLLEKKNITSKIQ